MQYKIVRSKLVILYSAIGTVAILAMDFNPW